MEKCIFHQMIDNIYIGIITILDYELSLKKCLSEFSFLPEENERKIIIDLALKCGINPYRFVVFDISNEGEILWNSNKYIIPNKDIVNLANMYLREQGNIVANSMLPQVKKKEILSV